MKKAELNELNELRLSLAGLQKQITEHERALGNLRKVYATVWRRYEPLHRAQIEVERLAARKTGTRVVAQREPTDEELIASMTDEQIEMLLVKLQQRSKT